GRSATSSPASSKWCAATIRRRALAEGVPVGYRAAMYSLLAVALVTQLTARARADESPTVTPGAHAAARETAPKPSRAYGWAFGAAAAATLVVGAGLAGAARVRVDEQNGNPAMPPAYTEELRARGVGGRDLASTSYVLFGIGAVAALIDAVVW